jgi:hypothetical protein
VRVDRNVSPIYLCLERTLNIALKRFIFDNHILIAAAAFLLLVGYWFVGPRNGDAIAQMLGVSAGLIGFVAFVLKQQTEEMKLFKELFKEFNDRYDKLKEPLNEVAIALRRDPSTQLENGEHEETLTKYFNLCGEEYLWFRGGYIGKVVWTAWTNGIKEILKTNERIREKWVNELESGSYYGLEEEHLERES